MARQNLIRHEKQRRRHHTTHSGVYPTITPAHTPDPTAAHTQTYETPLLLGHTYLAAGEAAAREALLQADLQLLLEQGPQLAQVFNHQLQKRAHTHRTYIYIRDEYSTSIMAYPVKYLHDTCAYYVCVHDVRMYNTYSSRGAQTKKTTQCCIVFEAYVSFTLRQSHVMSLSSSGPSSHANAASISFAACVRDEFHFVR